MRIKQYALVGIPVAAIAITGLIITTTPVAPDTVNTSVTKAEPIDAQLEAMKADNKSAESKLKQEQERLRALKEERAELESQL